MFNAFQQHWRTSAASINHEQGYNITNLLSPIGGDRTNHNLRLDSMGARYHLYCIVDIVVLLLHVYNEKGHVYVGRLCTASSLLLVHGESLKCFFFRRLRLVCKHNSCKQVDYIRYSAALYWEQTKCMYIEFGCLKNLRIVEAFLNLFSVSVLVAYIPKFELITL